MAERAADWSEHDLDHRFDLGPPTNELAALGQILDRLLDRVASAILAEQRLTAELAHELRTPLTSIKGSADLALMRGVDDPGVAASSSRSPSPRRNGGRDQHPARHLSRRRGLSPHSRAWPPTCSATRQGPPATASVVVRADVSSARIAAPRAVALGAVKPLLDNAVQHAASRVVLEAVDHADRVDLVVSDDGPGIDPDGATGSSSPGSPTATAGPGSGSASPAGWPARWAVTSAWRTHLRTVLPGRGSWCRCRGADQVGSGSRRVNGGARRLPEGQEV